MHVAAFVLHSCGEEVRKFHSCIIHLFHLLFICYSFDIQLFHLLFICYSFALLFHLLHLFIHLFVHLFHFFIHLSSTCFIRVMYVVLKCTSVFRTPAHLKI